jgi:hypothetical protein
MADPQATNAPATPVVDNPPPNGKPPGLAPVGELIAERQRRQRSEAERQRLATELDAAKAELARIKQEKGSTPNTPQIDPAEFEADPAKVIARISREIDSKVDERIGLVLNEARERDDMIHVLSSFTVFNTADLELRKDAVESAITAWQATTDPLERPAAIAAVARRFERYAADLAKTGQPGATGVNPPPPGGNTGSVAHLKADAVKFDPADSREGILAKAGQAASAIIASFAGKKTGS